MPRNQQFEPPVVKDQMVCQLEMLHTRSRVALEQVEIRARDLEAGLRRLTQLYKHSPVPFVSFDEGARIVDVNPAAARLLKIAPASVLGLSFAVLIADKMSARFVEHLRQARRSADTPVRTELNLITGDCHRLPVEILSCPVPLDTGRIYETAIIDLTDRQAAAEAIRTSNEYAQNIVATIPFPVLVLDSHARVTCANSAFLNIFGTTEKQVVSWPVSQLPGVQWHSIDLEKALMRALNDGAVIEEMVLAAELQRGSVVWLQLNARRLTGKSDFGPQLLVAFEDITRRKRDEEERHVLFTELESSRALLEQRVEERTEQLARSYGQLRTLGEQLVLAHESEQRRIARELHDQIGQDLTALKITLNRGKAGKPDDAMQVLQEAAALTDEMLQTVRDICGTLRPQVLDDLGLVAGLQWHVKTFAQRTGLDIAVDVERIDEAPLSPIVKSTIFRVIQEALTNVSRHAETTSASVTLRMQNGCVNFSVRDGGKGFDAAEVAKQNSTGISGMRERLSLVGGKFEISSSPDEGTTISASIPVPLEARTPTNSEHDRTTNGKRTTDKNRGGGRPSPGAQRSQIAAG
jgi:PAS domain S-box-containing protein